MYVGKLTSRLPLHECMSHISIYWLILFHPFVDFCFWQKGVEHCFVFTLTPLLMIDKKGEKYFSIYACLSFCIYWVYACLCIVFMHLLFYKMGKCFWKFKQKRGEKFLEKGFWIYVLSLTLLMHIHLFSFMCFIEYLICLLLCMS